MWNSPSAAGSMFSEVCAVSARDAAALHHCASGIFTVEEIYGVE
jgi:hypothetical protein